MIDTDAIKRIPISQIIGKYITLKKNGKHYDALCPFHDDKEIGNFKVTDSKGMYNCFSCHAHGDAIEFVMAFKFPNLSKEEAFAKACEEITGLKLKEIIRPHEKKVVQINPVPESAGLPKNLGDKHWIYRNPDGTIYGIVKRVNGVGKKKDFYPMIYTADGWVTKGFQGKIPLYGIHYKTIQATALLVEGEKTADYLRSVLPDKLVVTWPGGTNKPITSIDWSEIHGLDIVMFPDNDNTGFKAMHSIRMLLGDRVGSVKWVKPLANAPVAWDVADSGYDKATMIKYINDNISDYTGNEIYRPFEPDIKPISYEDNNDLIADDDKSGYPFTLLGYTKSDSGSQIFHIYSKDSKTILSYSAAGLTGNNLLTIAPANFWEMTYPSTKGGINSFGAANFIIDGANKMGKFDSDILRGRGAWIDGKDVIYHAGDKLFINGKAHALGRPPGSQYIYESGIKLDISLNNPLTALEGAQLFEVLKLINFTNDYEHLLFGGWYFLAPICGALK